MKKKKYWVVYDEDYPKGLIFEERLWALDYSKENRENGVKSYVRPKSMTEEEFSNYPEVD